MRASFSSGPHRARTCVGLVVLTVLVLVLAGDLRASDAAGTSSLVPVPAPDLGGLDPAVAQQLREQQARIEAARANPGQAGQDLAEAFGRMGMLYQVYAFNDAAIACYRNAADLRPAEFRWPYLQGFTALGTGDVELAAASFARASAIRPDHTGARVWQAESLRLQNKGDLAEPLFEKALELDPNSVAALYGSGQLALARGDHARAVERFEAALAVKPDATMIHFGLGMAYRGLGDMGRAREHLNRAAVAPPTRGFDPMLYDMRDPILAELQQILTGTQIHRSQGAIAMQHGRPDVAAREFRLAVEGDPSDARTRRSLALALAASGDREGALSELARALRDAEGQATLQATLHVDVGTLLEQQGQPEAAREQFRTAVALGPAMAETHIALARLLVQDGRAEEAAEHYLKAVEARPDELIVRCWLAMALELAGRHVEARDVLEGVRADAPDDPFVVNALARVLAASPSASVRNGRRALDLMKRLASQQPVTPAQAQTMAMALAEVGKFSDAMVWQEKIVAEAKRLGTERLLAPLEEELAGYRQQKPCRVPWRRDDPAFLPPPGPVVERTPSGG